MTPFCRSDHSKTDWPSKKMILDAHYCRWWVYVTTQKNIGWMVFNNWRLISFCCRIFTRCNGRQQRGVICMAATFSIGVRPSLQSQCGHAGAIGIFFASDIKVTELFSNGNASFSWLATFYLALFL